MRLLSGSSELKDISSFVIQVWPVEYNFASLGGILGPVPSRKESSVVFPQFCNRFIVVKHTKVWWVS